MHVHVYMHIYVYCIPCVDHPGPPPHHRHHRRGSWTTTTPCCFSISGITFTRLSCWMCLGPGDMCSSNYCARETMVTMWTCNTLVCVGGRACEGLHQRACVDGGGADGGVSRGVSWCRMLHAGVHYPKWARVGVHQSTHTRN